MASSSSASASCNYDVFLSFRGEDTRENFTSHLFASLCRKKIYAFMDEAISKGDKISPELLNAIIEGSKISVIILSEDYASSKWCLDELVKILECKEKNGQIVIPVFYHVHPTDVRKQTGIFGKAFVENEKKFKKIPLKVQKWREALTETSYLSGYESSKFRPEAKLVDVIVQDVLKKLEVITVSTDSNDLVGINSRIERVKSLLCVGLPVFRVVGIWGMGGIGKTTLAKAIFEQVSHDFEGKCFMSNVKEKSERGGGLEQLQKEVLCCLLGDNLEIGGPNIPQYTKKRLQRMKVIIVLDDVDTLEQLEYLVGGLDRFGPESRIIITTRDRSVLDKYGVENIYEVEKLKSNEPFELFYKYAFRENSIPQDLTVFLMRVVDYAKGNPLALKVLGSFLYRKSKLDWENALHNLKEISNPDIYDVLKISYNNLNPKVRSIFLDIACFFNGYDRDDVPSIFYDRELMHYGLNVLVDKSLISISWNKLEMHDLLQEMGREIVHQESEEEPGKRSRLWYHNDILHVLNKNKGTSSIKGIFLDLSKIKDINLDSKAFANMSNLRLLKFYMPEQSDVLDMRCKVHLPQGLEYLSDELRYLYWHGYPLGTLPMNFSPENLIELSLPCSKVEQLWNGEKEAFNLKAIDLRHSQYLTRIPSPLDTPYLERINLLNCVNLPFIPSFIQNFSNLGTLSLKGCKSLNCFPNNIQFRSPITIDMSHCVNLTEFPKISGTIMELNLGGTAIEEVPSSVESLSNLEVLNLSYCKRLKILSTSICKLKSLNQLDLSNCSKLESFPEILEKMERLSYIDLEFTAIKELSSSIENVERLRFLSLRNCSELHSLPQNLWNLKSLNAIYGEKSSISQLPSSITDLNELDELWFSGCQGLVLPSLSHFSSLRDLKLDHCGIMEIPQDIDCLSSLKKLNLKGNNFESLPTSIKHLSKLEELILGNCNMLQSLPELPLQLFYLDATNCKQLQSLPELPSCLEESETSALEKLSKQFHHICSSSKELNFTNCLKLNERTNINILEDSQLRIQHMTTASLRQFYEEEIWEPHGVSICLPGSGIPDWFSYQNSGSSINIQLPQLCCNRNFIGFAFCAVITFEELFHALVQLIVVCQYSFDKKTFSENKHFDRDFTLTDGKPFDEDYLSYDSNHVYLGFDPFLPDGDHHTTASFDFYIHGGGEKAKVKCCGVCPLYAHPIETKPNTFTVNMLQPTEEECRKLHNEFHEETSTSATATGRPEEEEISAHQQNDSFLSQIFGCWGLDCSCLWRF